jgi:hypothetical protein
MNVVLSVTCLLSWLALAQQCSKYKEAAEEKQVVTKAEEKDTDMGTKIEPVDPWAKLGSAVNPPGSLKDTGWVGGEQPEAEYFNRLEQEDRDKLNEIVGPLIRSLKAISPLVFFPRPLRPIGLCGTVTIRQQMLADQSLI